jgi:hypothetical protein
MRYFWDFILKSNVIRVNPLQEWNAFLICFYRVHKQCIGDGVCSVGAKIFYVRLHTDKGRNL